MGEEPTGSDVAQRMDMQIEESGNGFTVAIEEKNRSISQSLAGTVRRTPREHWNSSTPGQPNS
jgi:hypothetical protein